MLKKTSEKTACSIMLFGSYIGSQSHLPAWQDVSSRHASKISMNVREEIHHLVDGRVVCLTWFFPQCRIPSGAKETPGEAAMLSVCGVPADEDDVIFWDKLLEPGTTNAVKVGIHLASGEIRAMVPAATPQQCFFASDKRGRAVSNDMRLLIHWAGLDLDELAVYSLLQSGFIPPRLSMSKRVRRIPAGHSLKWASDAAEPEISVNFRLPDLLPPEADPGKLVESTLDQILGSVPPSSMLFFSGGVDSSLLALRLKELGRNDIRLVNYAFSPQDPEGHYAQASARSIGLSCHEILFQSDEVDGLLQRLGSDYSFPFGDYSTIPTNLLVNRAADMVDGPTTVIEGTGADGGFAVGLAHAGWARLYGKSRLARRTLGAMYRCLALWRRPLGVSPEFISGACRLSMQYSLRQAFLCQNSLNRIAYTIPQSAQEALDEAVCGHVDTLSHGLDDASQLSLADVVQICAGRFAAKSYDPMLRRGLRPLYPFLEPPALRMSLALSWDRKCAHGQAKALLKTLLANKVPHDLIYRQKIGFIPPIQQILAYDSVQDFFRNVVLSPHNPLAPFFHAGPVAKMIDRCRHGRHLAHNVHLFLWYVMFTSGWLNQCDFVRR